MVWIVRNQPLKLVAATVTLLLLTVACGRDGQPPEASFSVRMLTVRTISGRWERAAERGERFHADADAFEHFGVRIRVHGDVAATRKGFSDAGLVPRIGDHDAPADVLGWKLAEHVLQECGSPPWQRRLVLSEPACATGCQDDDTEPIFRWHGQAPVDAAERRLYSRILTVLRWV